MVNFTFFLPNCGIGSREFCSYLSRGDQNTTKTTTAMTGRACFLLPFQTMPFSLFPKDKQPPSMDFPATVPTISLNFCDSLFSSEFCFTFVFGLYVAFGCMVEATFSTETQQLRSFRWVLLGCGLGAATWYLYSRPEVAPDRTRRAGCAEHFQLHRNRLNVIVIAFCVLLNLTRNCLFRRKTDSTDRDWIAGFYILLSLFRDLCRIFVSGKDYTSLGIRFLENVTH